MFSASDAFIFTVPRLLFSLVMISSFFWNLWALGSEFHVVVETEQLN